MNRRYPVHFARDLTRIIALLLTSVSMAMAATPQAEQTVEQPRVSATALAVLRDGVPLIGRSDGLIVAIDPNTGATTSHFARHTASVTDLAIDPRGEFVAAASMDGFVAIWPVIVERDHLIPYGVPGQLVVPAHVLTPTPEIWNDFVQVDWTHDGSHLVTWSFDWQHGDSPTTVQLWTRDAELLWTGPHARQVSVHPTRNCIAAVVEDAVLLGWPGTDLRTIGLSGAYDAVEFSADGTRLAVGGRDHGVWVLDVASGVPELCGRAADVNSGPFGDCTVRIRWSPDDCWLGVVVGKGLNPGILDASDLSTAWAAAQMKDGWAKRLHGARMWSIFDVVWTPGGRMLTGFNRVVAVDPKTGETQKVVDGAEHDTLIDIEDSDEVLLLADGAVRRIDLETARVAWTRSERARGAHVETTPAPAAERPR